MKRRHPSQSLPMAAPQRPPIMDFRACSDAGGLLNIHTGGGSEHLSLEEIAYKYGTDKSKGDHKYVDLYMMLFDPIRTRVRNVTEVGVAHGQSLRVARLLANAVVWNSDNKRPQVPPQLL